MHENTRKDRHEGKGIDQKRRKRTDEGKSTGRTTKENNTKTMRLGRDMLLV